MGDVLLRPSRTLEILGLHLDERLSPAPALAHLKGTVARLVGTAIRTRPLLLPCVYLPMMQALINGAVGSYAAATVHIRTDAKEACYTTGSLAAQVQVLLNDAARAMIGVRRADRLNVAATLDGAGVTGLNRAAFRSAALLAWSAVNEVQHPLANIVAGLAPDARTRAAAAHSLLPVPPRVSAISVVVANMVKAWNFSVELRQAKTKLQAKNIIKKVMRQIPM